MVKINNDDLLIKYKEGMEYYSRLMKEDPKNRERYEPAYYAYRNALLELDEKERKANAKQASVHKTKTRNEN